MFGAGFSNETDRGEFRGRGWRSPPSRGGRGRHALVVEAEIPVLSNGGCPPRCSRGCPRHVARAKCCSSRDSSELPKYHTDLTDTSIEETSVDPRAGKRGSTAISGHVAVRHHREGGLSTTADSLRRLDSCARGPHTRAGASARENIPAPFRSFARDTTSTSVADPAPPHLSADPPQLRFRIELDTGILSFRARDEPYAINYDAVLSAIQWGKGHTQHPVSYTHLTLPTIYSV